LLDSEILAEVYLELIGGRQPDFVLAQESRPAQQDQGSTAAQADWRPRPRPTALPPRLTEAEVAAHQAFVEKMGESAIWTKRI
jgi:DNA polymerase-3 subunit epsilon